jgi:hypothetical protein
MVRQGANLHMKEISWTIFNFIHDSICYMNTRSYLTNEVIQQLNSNIFLGHVYRGHLHNLAHRHSRVIHKLISLVFGTGGREALARVIQVGLGVE